MAYGAFLDQVVNFVGVGLALYAVASAYGWASSDPIVKRQVKCRYCKKWISEKVSGRGVVFLLFWGGWRWVGWAD